MTTTPPTTTPPTDTPPTKHGQQQGPEVAGPSIARGFGWGEPTARGRRRATAATTTATPGRWTGTQARWRRNVAAAERGSGAGDRNDTAADRNADGPERNAPAGPDAAVPAVRSDAARSGAVVSVRTAETVQEWTGGLRPWNLPLGSPRQLVQFARTAPVNLGHIDAVRAANLIFVRFICIPAIISVSFILWAYFTQLHRAIGWWVVTLVVAHFLNRRVDGLVPDELDAATWSAATWQWVVGGLAAFAVATTVVLVRRRR